MNKSVMPSIRNTDSRWKASRHKSKKVTNKPTRQSLTLAVVSLALVLVICGIFAFQIFYRGLNPFLGVDPTLHTAAQSSIGNAIIEATSIYSPSGSAFGDSTSETGRNM
ncbi:MAG: hypothetical protein HKL80_11685 [Acidimicrobiales bacterium]|nr:hypothetical protein [Acidimicrobiales bacterium]